jgi:polyphenol oxidase
MPGSSLHADWITPDWPAAASVRAVFTTRTGGASRSPFDSFNLGDHVRDEPAAVDANRAHLSEVLGSRPVFLKQVHGRAVVGLSGNTADGTEADACIASEPGVACTIMVADCLPVLLTNAAGSVVGAAHAGWRGLAGAGAALAGGGVLEALVEAFVARATDLEPKSARQDVLGGAMAWLGPCIGPEAFEVGAEVRAAFMESQDGADQAFAEKGEGAPGKYLANLSMLAHARLRTLGIPRIYGNDGSIRWCTVSQASAFFSHRRDAVRLGSTGRMAACIWLV